MVRHPLHNRKTPSPVNPARARSQVKPQEPEIHQKFRRLAGMALPDFRSQGAWCNRPLLVILGVLSAPIVIL